MRIETPPVPSGRPDSVEAAEARIVVKDFPEAVEHAKASLRRELEARFGLGGKEPLDFHSPEHSERVSALSREFLEIVRSVDPALVTDRDLGFVELEGLAHDLVQQATVGGGKMRRRHRGAAIGNERASAEVLLQELGKYVDESGNLIFPLDGPVSPSDPEALYEAAVNDIGATYPDFAFGAALPDGTKGFKVHQPHLVPQGSLRSLALATADLRGAVGASDFPAFQREGDAEFRELQESIKEELRGEVANIPAERRAKIASSILDWVKAQEGFGKWQRQLFEESIAANEALQRSEKSDEILEALRQRYRHFDDNIAAATDRSQNLEERFGFLRDAEAQRRLIQEGNDAPFVSLLEEVGYLSA